MAKKVNIEIEQGATFELILDLQPNTTSNVSFSGYTSRGQIRKHPKSNTYYSFDTSISNSYITLTMSSNVTSNISGGLYLYDVELINSDGKVTRKFSGLATVSSEITK